MSSDEGQWYYETMVGLRKENEKLRLDNMRLLGANDRIISADMDSVQAVVIALRIERDKQLSEIAALKAELAGYKADIEAGRMVKIPATPGEVVWWIDSCGEIRRGVVVRVHLVGNEVHTAIEGKTDMFRSDKGIYRSEKAARAALEGGQADE